MTPYELPLRQALDAAGEVIFMTDRDGVFTFVNRGFERVYGYSAPEVVGRCTPRILQSGQTPPDAYATWWTRLMRGESLRERFVNRTRDGRLIEVEVSVSAVRSNLQEIIGFLAVQRDITFQEQAELALRRSEERYRALAETASDAIFIVDRDNRFEYLNASAVRHLGSPATSPIARRIEECFGPEVGPRLSEQLDQARQSPTPVYEERQIQFPVGVRWVGTWLQSIGAGDGRSGSVMGISRDITTQREMAALLERQNRLMSAIIDTSPVGIVLLNTETWVCDIANAAARALGAPQLASGVRLADGWPEAAAQLVPLLERAMRSQNSVVNADLDLPEAGGQRHITASASRIQLPSRAPSVLVMLSDVTERLGLEQQLLQAQKMEAIGRLAGGIAHDFNNLLTPILGYADLIMATLAPDDRRRSDVDEVCRAAKSATALTRQLLTFSRKQVTDPAILNLNTVLSDVEAMLRRSIGEDVDVVQRHASDLGDVRVDRNQFEQVVMNLSVNARDAMPHGGVLTIATANATLAAPVSAMPGRVPPGNYIVLSIADTGAGMTPEVLAHLFEPFYTTKEFGKGTGLGLSTVLGIISESGGHIAVESAPQQGTTFTIYLPRVSAEALPHAEPQSQAEPELPAGHETILIVEDNEGLRHLAQRVLTGLGYTTLAEANADEALRTIHEYCEPIHLLLTDIVMPGADGVTLARRVTFRRPDTRVLFMSGYSSRDLADRHTQMNGRKLLQKPFSRLALARAVREALDLPPASSVQVA